MEESWYLHTLQEEDGNCELLRGFWLQMSFTKVEVANPDLMALSSQASHQCNWGKQEIFSLIVSFWLKWSYNYKWSYSGSSFWILLLLYFTIPRSFQELLWWMCLMVLKLLNSVYDDAAVLGREEPLLCWAHHWEHRILFQKLCLVSEILNTGILVMLYFH